MPRRCHIGEILHFGESGGHLHYVRVYGQLSPQFDVYEMESDYSKWFVKYIVDLDLGVSTFPEMFRMYHDRFTLDYVVDMLCLVGGEVERDSCLILYIASKVISYKFKDRSFRKVCNLELLLLDYDSIRHRPWFTIYPSRETPFHV
ncbi:F-box protein [Camellia lanceoleosa]|uniref:F-box protein n=1 Tax=Camellia lanceoleosa TaxID=1840588 RepID=A0ACC0HZC0_9ERIC|nr:F-box protein [Camellia lanceoleosa]